VIVPSAAIQSGLQGAFVWVIDTDAKGAATSKIQPVKVALAEGQITILDSGLNAGQNVVVDGADRLRAGQIVTASVARQRGAQATGQGIGSASGQQPASPFAAAGAGSSPTGKNDDKGKK
jgi:multidrug efflux system membrane fusion protein